MIQRVSRHLARMKLPSVPDAGGNVRRLLAAIATASLLVAGCSPGVKPPKPNGAPLAERGINLYVSTDPSVENSLKLNARLDAIFNYTRGLNANAVALSFPIFTDGPTGSTVSVRAKTPPLAMMKQIIQTAHARGLKVKLRPTIDPNNLPGTWPGALQPVNRTQWFATYTEVLKPYAELARQTGVAEFQVGTELDSLEGDPGWQSVLTTLKSVYRRTLSYAVHWELLQRGTAKPPTEVFGISAYPPFALADDVTMAELTDSWGRWLDRVGNDYALRRLVLDEVGFPGAKGMYSQPWSWDVAALEADPQMQANWFAAACAAARGRNLPGIYFWKLDLFRDPAAGFANGELPTQFVGRAGEAAIRTCFAD